MTYYKAFITKKEACQILGISNKELKELIDTNLLHIKTHVFRKYLITKEVIQLRNKINLKSKIQN